MAGVEEFALLDNFLVEHRRPDQRDQERRSEGTEERRRPCSGPIVRFVLLSAPDFFPDITFRRVTEQTRESQAAPQESPYHRQDRPNDRHGRKMFQDQPEKRLSVPYG